MSSYELLELFGATVVDDPETKTRTIYVDFPPEDGAVAGVMRGGEPAEWKQAVLQVANESSVLRAAYVPDAQADEYGARLFLSTARMRERAADREREINQPDEPGGLYSLWQEVS